MIHSLKPMSIIKLITIDRYTLAVFYTSYDCYKYSIIDDAKPLASSLLQGRTHYGTNVPSSPKETGTLCVRSRFAEQTLLLRSASALTRCVQFTNLMIFSIPGKQQNAREEKRLTLFLISFS